MTPHIEAKKEEIASSVLMPGDPLRAKYIAENFLQDVTLVSSVRGIYAYTGTYHNKKITVMASGMGNPSMGIYSYELFHFYNVKNIIRIGTCGAYVDSLKLKDVILVKNSYSKSSYAKVQDDTNINTIPSSTILNKTIQQTAITLNIPLHFETIYCSDVFYASTENFKEISGLHDCVGVEMESFALFQNARHLGKNAACILSVSDSFVFPDKLTPEERQTSLDTMISLGLESICQLS